ncbi:MAG: energy-coupled thiamine transporter ThiT [Defluviitaleaceae bacterium]|nr:energy-coupled thiamine transporter ThiT [Defluviitaleaceae bacterium]
MQSMTGSKKLTVAAMCIAMAFMLNQVPLFRMPQGGSVTPASMLFIVLAGYWLGPIFGIITGVSMGLLNAATGAYFMHPVSLLLDYPLAFGMLGIAGFFRKTNYGLQVGYVAGVLGRLLMVFISGVVFWSDIANVGLASAASFSIIYNMTYIVPEMVVTLVIISLPSLRHAIDIVTKGVVPYDDYIAITRRNKASISARARLVTGAVMGALGGLAFVLAAYISRLEHFTVMQYVMGVELIANAPSRIVRMIERNTGQIAGLQIVGVLFLALGVGLIFSVLLGGVGSVEDRVD